MTDEEREQIRERAEKATPGPWERGYGSRYGDVLAWRDGGVGQYALATTNAHVKEDNAAFIAHARTDIPALLAEVDALRVIARAVAALEMETVEHVDADGIEHSHPRYDGDEVFALQEKARKLLGMV